MTKIPNKILVTGAAGFIGFHLCRRLLASGRNVVGLDNLNSYYDPTLKQARLREIKDLNFIKLDLTDKTGIVQLFAEHKFDFVVNLAAQAGVRYSLENPHSYVDSNIVGFLNILEGCRHTKVKHLVFASSSSVYGANTRMPFSVRHNVDHPVSLYAATKKANELMAHSYASLYGLPCTGLRFFTVYGPWGRPDMALFLFTKAILEDKPIDVYNQGKMRRDFTYIDDIIEGVVRIIFHTPQEDFLWNGNLPNPSSSYAPYKLYNIGNDSPVNLLTFIETLEKTLGKKAQKNYLPLQAGDVPTSWADVSDLFDAVGFRPHTTIDVGIKQFVDWYLKYYHF